MATYRMSDLSNVRRHFPFLSEVAYLDTAAAGLTPPGVGSAVAHYLDVVKGRGILGRPQWRERGQQLRNRLAPALCVSPVDISFFSNTAEGINLVAHSLPWRAGDQVVLAADEFPTMLEAWHVAAARGAHVIPVPIASELLREDLLLNALSAQTRVLAVSHVHWGTGTCLDLDRLGRRCQELGTLLVVDGTQALGAVPVDLSRVDIYSAATFKWVLASFGFAILATSQRARDQFQPAFRGAMNTPPHLNYSHPNYAGIYALDAALEFLDSCGWAAIYDKVRALTTHLGAGLRDLGYEPRASQARTAGIVSFETSADLETLNAQLQRRGLQVTLRGTHVRVSPHFYNDQFEIDRFLQAIRELRPAPLAGGTS